MDSEGAGGQWVDVLGMHICAGQGVDSCVD